MNFMAFMEGIWKKSFSKDEKKKRSQMASGDAHKDLILAKKKDTRTSSQHDGTYL